MIEFRSKRLRNLERGRVGWGAWGPFWIWQCQKPPGRIFESRLPPLWQLKGEEFMKFAKKICTLLKNNFFAEMFARQLSTNCTKINISAKKCQNFAQKPHPQNIF